MSNRASRNYEVQQLVPFKGWQCVSKARADLGVALDEYRAYVRVADGSVRFRLINTATGRVIKQHLPASKRSSGKKTNARSGRKNANAVPVTVATTPSSGAPSPA